MSDSTRPRQRDERGRLLPADNPSDYTRYAMGDRDPAARAAKAADKRERAAAKALGRPAGEVRAVGVNVALGGTVTRVRLTRAETETLGTLTRSRSGYIADLLREQGVRDAAGLAERAGQAGVSRSEYIRGVLLKDLGQQAAARPAPGRG